MTSWLQRIDPARRTVSVRRRRLGWAALASVVAAFVWFQWSTSDAVIAQRVVRALERASGGKVTLDRARFRLFHGIELYDLRVSTPPDATVDAGATTPTQREIFSAGFVRLLHDPWRLLTGRLAIDELQATDARFTIVHNSETERFNWQSLFANRKRGGSLASGDRPIMRLRRAEVVLQTIEANTRRGAEIIKLDADVFAHPAVPTAFLVDIRKFSERPSRSRMVFDPIRGRLSDAPVVGLAAVRRVLPKVYQDFFERLSLTGDIRSEVLNYGSADAQRRRYRISLHGVRLSIPLAMLGPALPAAEQNAQAEPPADDAAPAPAAFELMDIEGAFDLSGDRAAVELTGRLNDAACRVRGEFRRVDLPLDRVGLDVRFETLGLPMPEGRVRDRLIADPRVPRKIHEFIEMFDPFGRFDLAGTLRREPDDAAPPQFRGVLTARGVSAAHRSFPYRVDELQGEVRFEDDGIHFASLIGRHGSAVVRVDGRLDAARWDAAADLRFRATGVPFDLALFEALAPKYQRMWTLLNPRGLADVDLRLSRPTGDPAAGPTPWRTDLDVELLDARICVSRFPYELTHVRGGMSVRSGAIRLAGLIGRCDDGLSPAGESAAIRVDGDVWDDETAGASRVELRIEARGVPVDDRLVAALPGDAQAAVKALGPRGVVDLLGRVFTDPQGEVAFDLQAHLRNATLALGNAARPLRDVEAKLHMTPRHVTLVDFLCEHGAGRLTATGEAARLTDGFKVDLLISGQGLALEQVRELAGATVDQAWTALAPSGTADLTARWHMTRHGEREVRRQRADLQLRDVSITLPAPRVRVEHLGGRVSLDDRSIGLEGLSGQCLGGTIRADGSLDMSRGGTSGALRLEAAALDAGALLKAWGRPAGVEKTHRGRLDVLCDNFTFSRGADGMTWEATGRVGLRGISAEVGARASQVDGELRGRAWRKAGEPASFDGSAEFLRGRIAGLALENIRFRAALAARPRTVRLSDLRADLFGGTLGGTCDVALDGPRPRFALNLVVQDAALSRLLTMAKSREADGGPGGVIDGRLSLQGELGDAKSRRGGGEFSIRQAEIWKAPLGLAIFQVLNLAPNNNAFHDAWLRFYVDGTKVHFTQIDLQGHAMSFVGAGTLDSTSGELNLALLAGSPVRLRLPLLTDLVEGASHDLRQVTVTGTIRSPRIELGPQSDLRRTLESVFRERPPPRPPSP